MTEAPAQQFKDGGIAGVAYRKRRVAGFAGHGAWSGTGKIAGEAEAGARCDDRDGLAHDGASLAHRDHIVGTKMRHGPGQGLEVVDQTDRPQMQRLPEALSVERPGGIGEFAAAARDGTGRGNHRTVHDRALRLPVEKVVRGIMHAGVGTGAQRFDRPHLPVREQGKAGARPPHIAKQATHDTPPRTWAAMVALYQRAEALGMRRCVG